jgi:DNA-directed RNA polymerase subunit RPC12/RpoP
MVVSEMKCSTCGGRFEAEIIDREDSRERYIQGVPLRCPNCKSTMVEKVRVIRRATRRVP